MGFCSLIQPGFPYSGLCRAHERVATGLKVGHRSEYGKPCAVKVACTGCAVRRFEIFLLQAGGTREEFLSYQLT